VWPFKKVSRLNLWKLKYLAYRNGSDHLCGLVVRVPGYRSRGLVLPDFLRSSGSATGFAEPCE
jgi:hypothetical protein